MYTTKHGVPVLHLTELEIPIECKWCGRGSIRTKVIEGQEFIDSSSIYQNDNFDIFYLFHKKCKKRWINSPDYKKLAKKTSKKRKVSKNGNKNRM